MARATARIQQLCWIIRAGYTFGAATAWDLDSLLPSRIHYRNRNMATPPLTPAVFHILLALADRPLHGYAIMQAAESTAGVTMGPGTIYGTLERLERAGLVREHAAPGGRRRVFAIEPAGRAALREEAQRLARLVALARAKRLVPRES
jgi:DNA-binding MarR family transcriptional regulator